MIVAKGSVQDALGFACLANLRHGKALTREEKKKAICQYIKLNSKLSNRLIGDHVGKSEGTIRLYRDELIDMGELKPEEKVIGKDGKEQLAEKVGAQNYAPDPFEEWFTEHVTMGDVFDVLEKELLRLETDFLAKLSPILSMFTSAT